MYCSNCGTNLEANSKFCVRCGAQLTNINQENVQYSVNQGQISSQVARTSNDSSNKLSTWGWILATIGSFIMPLLALVGIVLGIILLSRNDNTGSAIGIIIVSIFVGIFSYYFWTGFWIGYYGAY